MGGGDREACAGAKRCFGAGGDPADASMGGDTGECSNEHCWIEGQARPISVAGSVPASDETESDRCGEGRIFSGKRCVVVGGPSSYRRIPNPRTPNL